MQTLPAVSVPGMLAWICVGVVDVMDDVKSWLVSVVPSLHSNNSLALLVPNPLPTMRIGVALD